MNLSHFQFLLHLHYLKCCQHVARTCRVDHLYWFWLENPSASLHLSDSRVPIKPLQRLLPSQQLSLFFGFQASCRAALDSADVSLNTSHKPKPNDPNRTKTSAVEFHRTPAVRKNGIADIEVQYVRGVHALIPCVESAVDLAGTRWKPRCPEMCRGGGAEKPLKSASFQRKIIEGSCGGICSRHFEHQFLQRV